MASKRYAADGKLVLSKDERIVRGMFCRAMNDFRERKYMERINYDRVSIPSWDGGLTSSGRFFKSHVWGRMLAFVQKHQLDPFDYFTWFMENWTSQGLPFLNYVMNASKANEYKAVRGSNRVSTQVVVIRKDFERLLANLEYKVAAERVAYGRNLTAEQATVNVLCQNQIVLDPVLNYIVAFLSNLPLAKSLLYDAAYEHARLRKHFYVEAFPAILQGRLLDSLEHYNPENQQ